MRSVQSVRLDGWVCAVLADGQLTVSFFFFLEESLLDRGCVSSLAVPWKGGRTTECLRVGLPAGSASPF